MPDTTDPAVSALDGIRERADAVSKAVAQLADAAIDAGAAQVPEVAARPAILARLASSFDVPCLLKAVGAALAFHEEFDGTCGSCLDVYGDRIDWPCEEYRAITAALAGKEADDAGIR